MIIENQYIKQVLIESGWHENRAIDTSHYIKWYQKYGFKVLDEIISFLSSFGELTLKIPCYRYQVRLTKYEDNTDEIITINPNHFITPDYSDSDIKESIEYVNDIGKYFGMKLIVPIGYTKDFEDEYFLGMNTELIAAHEGNVICFGTTFEKSLERIMTDEFIDTDCIW